MSVDLHHRAVALMGEADVLEHEGRVNEAALARHQAADLEAQVFAGLPSSRPRTRGIISVSVVALLSRAGALEEAISQAHRYLAEDLPEHAQLRLEDLVREARRKKHAQVAGYQLGVDTFDISLDGPGVGYGYAPLELVSEKLKQLESFIYRVGEWLIKIPLRQQGRPGDRVQRLCSPVIGEPVAGSFGFSLRLAPPLQPTFDIFKNSNDPGPDQVSNEFYDLLSVIVRDTPEELERRVPDQGYRQTFVRLARNLVPDGQDVNRLEIRRLGKADVQSVTITPGTRASVRRLIDTEQQLTTAEDKMVEYGILRALHLDKGWIIINREDGDLTCHTGNQVALDELIGPYVNRRVQVTGYWKKYRNARWFMLLDVELAAGASAGTGGTAEPVGETI